MHAATTEHLRIDFVSYVFADVDRLSFHEDYYLGFSQGVYYGLLLAGTEYDIAWCVKGELAYEGDAIGTGSEFQQALETVLRKCQQAIPGRNAN